MARKLQFDVVECDTVIDPASSLVTADVSALEVQSHLKNIKTGQYQQSKIPKVFSLN